MRRRGLESECGEPVEHDGSHEQGRGIFVSGDEQKCSWPNVLFSIAYPLAFLFIRSILERRTKSELSFLYIETIITKGEVTMIFRMLSGSASGAIKAFMGELANMLESEKFEHLCTAELKSIKGVNVESRETKGVIIHLRSKLKEKGSLDQNTEAYIVLAQENQGQYRMNLGLCCCSMDLTSTISHPKRLKGGCKYSKDFDLIADIFQEVLWKEGCKFSFYESEQRSKPEAGFGPEKRKRQICKVKKF